MFVLRNLFLSILIVAISFRVQITARSIDTIKLGELAVNSETGSSGDDVDNSTTNAKSLKVCNEFKPDNETTINLDGRISVLIKMPS